MDVTVDSRELEAAFKRLQGVGVSLPYRLVAPLKRELLQVQARAQKLTPADGDRSLVRSARTDVRAVGAQTQGKITFGGLAAKYAEVQHENEDFAHTPAEYERKYGKPLNRTHWTRQTLRGNVGKRGKITVKSKTWRYKRKKKITGYTGGQAHFLHGARSSAWNDAAERRLQSVMALQSQQIIEAALSGKGGIA